MHIGEKIRTIRNHLDLTQEDFSKKLKIKRRTLQNYESKINEPSFSVIYDICKLFNINPGYLLTDDSMFFQSKEDNELSVNKILELVNKAFHLKQIDYDIITIFLEKNFSDIEKNQILDYINNLKK